MPHITTSEASVDERHFASKERCAGGRLLSALIVIIVAVVAEYQHLPWILLFIVGYRFQDYRLGPRLMGAEVGVQPILVLFGLLAGAEVAVCRAYSHRFRPLRRSRRG